MSSVRYTVLDRLFLRHCGLLMRLYKRDDADWVWLYASIGVNITVGTVAAAILMSMAVVFRDFLPPFLNPTTATKPMLYAQFGVIALAALLWVNYRFRRFKQDVSAAHAFKSGQDIWMLFAEVVFQVLCLAAAGILASKFRSSSF
jgi:hypothetical protein